MKIKDIALEVNPFGWSIKKQRLKSNAFLEIKQKFVDFKKSTCELCQYKSEDKYLHIINKNGNYKDNKGNNFQLACSLCTSCLFIGSYNPSTSVESIDRYIALKLVKFNLIIYIEFYLFVWKVIILNIKI